LRCLLNVASVDDILMSGGSSFQSRRAATLNVRLPSLSLVRGTTRSRFEADRSWVSLSRSDTDGLQWET